MVSLEGVVGGIRKYAREIVLVGALATLGTVAIHKYNEGNKEVAMVATVGMAGLASLYARNATSYSRQ